MPIEITLTDVDFQAPRYKDGTGQTGRLISFTDRLSAIRITIPATDEEADEFAEKIRSGKGLVTATEMPRG